MNNDEMRRQVEARVKKEAEDLAAADKKKGSAGGDRRDGKITSKFVQECLYANELGDGMLYAAIHKDKFLYDKSTGEWMVWAGHHWEDDIRAKSLAAVEDVALRYLEESQKVGNEIGLAVKNEDKDSVGTLQKVQENIYKKIFRVRSDRGRTNCLKFAHTNPVNGLDITSKQLDTNPWLFGCKNGVIDLRTGRLRPGRQDDYISRASSIEFLGIETPAPNWERFVSQIFNEHQSLVDYMGRVFGYSMVGKVVEHFLPILWGRGWNGKGTLIEIIAYVMGDLASPIQSEMLLDQSHGKSAGSASPEIMGLRGLRLAYASETEQGRRFSTSKVKWLTGGDTLKGRFLYDKRDVKFKPSHTLILMTNNKPNVIEDDYAFWQRVHLVPFELLVLLPGSRMMKTNGLLIRICMRSYLPRRRAYLLF
jgi:putative DNA primase/helicase